MCEAEKGRGGPDKARAFSPVHSGTVQSSEAEAKPHPPGSMLAKLPLNMTSQGPECRTSVKLSVTAAL